MGLYTYQSTFFTGTMGQPDTLSFFIKRKDENSFLAYHAEPFANLSGKYLPIAGSLTGVTRTVNAIKAIFNDFSKKASLEPNNAIWNSFKNLFRGIAEALPFTGIFLLIYDAVRNEVYVQAKIIKEIQGQENIAGIAIDGKLIFTIDLTKIENIFRSVKPETDQRCLAFFREMGLIHLKKEEEKSRSLKMTEVFLELKEAMERNSQPPA